MPVAGLLVPPTPPAGFFKPLAGGPVLDPGAVLEPAEGLETLVADLEDAGPLIAGLEADEEAVVGREGSLLVLEAPATGLPERCII